jgi:hypothetical protein
MDFSLLYDNLTNPALLFFVLGIFAVSVKSDLEIPPNSSRFISLYLLFSIGFKGGQELAHSHLGMDVLWSILFAIVLSACVPLIAFPILRIKLNNFDAGATASAYGSISAVTFVTAVSYLEIIGDTFSGHMVAIMALMEAPAIVAGIILIRRFEKDGAKGSVFSTVKHSLTNASVVLILGSLVIGFLASEKQAAGIAPFTTDIFKGFLAIFLLDMGIISGRKLKSFFQYGWFTLSFAVIFPLIMGVSVAFLSSIVTDRPSDRFIFAILAASASYIAVPATMKIAVPKANPGLYLPMALAVTFPVNLTIGIPLYYYLANL